MKTLHTHTHILAMSFFLFFAFFEYTKQHLRVQQEMKIIYYQKGHSLMCVAVTRTAISKPQFKQQLLFSHSFYNTADRIVHLIKLRKWGVGGSSHTHTLANAYYSDL